MYKIHSSTIPLAHVALLAKRLRIISKQAAAAGLPGLNLAVESCGSASWPVIFSSGTRSDRITHMAQITITADHVAIDDLTVVGCNINLRGAHVLITGSGAVDIPPDSIVLTGPTGGIALSVQALGERFGDEAGMLVRGLAVLACKARGAADSLPGAIEFQRKSELSVEAASFFAVAYDLANRFGFIGSHAAKEQLRSSTGEEAFDGCLDLTTPSHEGVVAAQAITRYYLSDSFKPKDNLGRQILRIIQEGYLTLEDANIAAAAVSQYRKHKRTQRNTSSQYIGEIGQRVELRLKLMAVFPLESDYDCHYMYLFEDDAKNSVAWRASTALSIPVNVSEMDEKGDHRYTHTHLIERGEIVKLRATIQAHEIFTTKAGEQIRTTHINRARVIGVESEDRIRKYLKAQADKKGALLLSAGVAA